MLTDYTISEDLLDELQRFLTTNNIADLNQNMRRQLIDYLDSELRTGVPLYLDGFLFHLTTCLTS